MSRPSAPWFRKGRRMFCSTIDGKQVILIRGDDTPENRRLAEEKHAELLAAASKIVAASVPIQSVTMSDAAAKFLASTARRHAAGRLADNTAASYRCIAGHVVAAFGERPASSITADELELWADRPEWSSSYQAQVLCVAELILRAASVVLDPPVRRPPIESRGADTVLTDDQFTRLVADLERNGSASADAGPLLRVLRECGARPSEVSGLTVDAVDWVGKCARLRKHKTRRKTGRDRIIYFTDAAMTVLERQRKKWGTGLLFRTRCGRRYSPTSLVKRMRDASKRLGFRVISYGMRHSFATAALEAGISDTIVAGLLGHSGTNMLHRHYSHVGSNAQAMRDAAERARGKAAG